MRCELGKVSTKLLRSLVVIPLAIFLFGAVALAAFVPSVTITSPGSGDDVSGSISVSSNYFHTVFATDPFDPPVNHFHNMRGLSIRRYADAHRNIFRDTAHGGDITDINRNGLAPDPFISGAFCIKMNMSLKRSITDAESKAAGIFEPDLARLLCSATREGWESVKWIKPPNPDTYIRDLQKLGEKLVL